MTLCETVSHEPLRLAGSFSPSDAQVAGRATAHALPADRANILDGYRAFLAAKAEAAPVGGFHVPASAINPDLKPHCRAIVPWALAGGCRAIFAAFGLHKTAMQLEIMRLVGLMVGGRQLIVLPLAVRDEFVKEAIARFTGRYAIRVKFIRSAEDLEPVSARVIYLTNYETVRDGKLDPGLFIATSLDEAACLRGFGGSKTFREFMRLFAPVPFKFVATATPSPNEYIEFLAYAAYLGVMDVGQAKTRFFKRNSEKADELTLHPHKEREFWLWVATWAVVITKPSDLGFDDTGYVLPDLDLRWHEVPSNHLAEPGEERDGQIRLLRKPAAGIVAASTEKRGSIDSRLARLMDIRAEDLGQHRIIWHDLEAEREAIEAAIPGVATVYGSQDPDYRDAIMGAFADGHIQELATKPVIAGSGRNFQKHCAWEIFLGLGFKFNDFIQAIHRVQRFGQTRTVRCDLIYTEAERGVRDVLVAKWKRHEEAMAIMTGIMREYGLMDAETSKELARSLFDPETRVEIEGNGYRLWNNDCVEECLALPDNSVDLIVTSIPFSTQYEYTPSYNDFGHTDDNGHFWRQMDYLIPQLLRVLKPGRDACIHVKDRIVPGGMTGRGFQTVYPFSDECVRAFTRNGFAFLGRKTNNTDVVRENNQTYRLGYSEQCKDGTRMGCGTPEYILFFRKDPSSAEDGYADVMVAKDKADYSLSKWQVDASAYSRSSGDRLLTPEEWTSLDAAGIYRAWRSLNIHEVYDFDHHVAIGDALRAVGKLPPSFMLLPPHSWHPDVWTDVAQMRSLNTDQAAKKAVKHLCPLPFDIVNRCIEQRSMPGEVVFDPFGGLMTVPFCALKLGRQGWGCELNGDYFRDGANHVQAAARGMDVPTLFDLTGDRTHSEELADEADDIIGASWKGEAA